MPYCVLPEDHSRKNLIGENRCQFFEDRTVTLLLIIDFFRTIDGRKGDPEYLGQNLARTTCVGVF